MRNWKRCTRLVLLVTFMLGVAAVLPQTARSVGGSDEPMYQWVVTPAAQLRSDAGDCPNASEVCKELCERYGTVSVGTGDFDCLPG